MSRGEIKAAAELKRKRHNAASMRSANGDGAIKGQKREDLDAWLEREVSTSMTLRMTRERIEDQRSMLRDVERRRERLAAQHLHDGGDTAGGGGGSVSSAFRALDEEIVSRGEIIAQLNTSAAELRRSVAPTDSSNPGPSPRASSLSSCFIDACTFNALTRTEVRYVAVQAYDRLLCSRDEYESLQRVQEEKSSAVVRKAVSERDRKAEAKISELKLQHAETVMSLLESTKGAIEQKVRLEVLKDDNVTSIDPSIQSSIDDMLGSFLSGCERVKDSVKVELKDVRNNHEDMKDLVDRIAQGMIDQNEATAVAKMTAKKHKKAKRSKSPMSDGENHFIFDDDEEEEELPSDDSDWSPDTPKGRRRQGRSAKAQAPAPAPAPAKADASGSCDDEQLLG